MSSPRDLVFEPAGSAKSSPEQALPGPRLARWRAGAAAWWRRHPACREVVYWCLPALVAGAFWRLLLVSYLPYGNWNADSRSYYGFAQNLMNHGGLSFYDKRRYLYPIFLLPVSWLPGGTLRGLPLLQHGLGWLTLLPLGYVVRRSFTAWKLWIVPLTVLYASLPMVLWYEREMLAEALFFDFLIWSMAGWMAWASEARPKRADRLFWLFFAPLFLFMITKPAGRFCWPGIAVGALLLLWQKKLRLWQAAALAALVALSLTAGSKTQSAWLLYDSCFPLTKLESPLLADYKAQIRDKVEEYRLHIDTYYGANDWPYEFLRDPTREPGRPLWYALGKNEVRRREVYKALAKEAIAAHPVLWGEMGLSRLVASANPSNFNSSRFRADFAVKHFEHFYAGSDQDEKMPVRELFGLPKREPLPPYSEFSKRLAPQEDPWAARVVYGWSRAFCSHADLLHDPATPLNRVPPRLPPMLSWLAWPSWCIFLGAALSLLLPQYRTTVGVWTLAIFGNLGAVFLVCITAARYFTPAWPVLFLLLVLPADWLIGLAWRRLRKPAAEIPPAVPA